MQGAASHLSKNQQKKPQTPQEETLSGKYGLALGSECPLVSRNNQFTLSVGWALAGGISRCWGISCLLRPCPELCKNNPKHGQPLWICLSSVTSFASGGLFGCCVAHLGHSYYWDLFWAVYAVTSGRCRFDLENPGVWNNPLFLSSCAFSCS